MIKINQTKSKRINSRATYLFESKVPHGLEKTREERLMRVMKSI